MKTERTVIVGMVCATVLGIVGCINDGQAATAAVFALAAAIISGGSYVVGKAVVVQRVLRLKDGG